MRAVEFWHQLKPLNLYYSIPSLPAFAIIIIDTGNRVTEKVFQQMLQVHVLR